MIFFPGNIKKKFKFSMNCPKRWKMVKESHFSVLKLTWSAPKLRILWLNNDWKQNPAFNLRADLVSSRNGYFCWRDDRISSMLRVQRSNKDRTRTQFSFVSWPGHGTLPVTELWQSTKCILMLGSSSLGSAADLVNSQNLFEYIRYIHIYRCILNKSEKFLGKFIRFLTSKLLRNRKYFAMKKKLLKHVKFF